MNSIALVGSPNSGKTSLFNALTGSRQKTANYAGVTVEKKEGTLFFSNQDSITLLDLPGTYSLEPKTPDEEITIEVLKGIRPDTEKPSVILAVADINNLERNLYLVLQLKDLGYQLVLALTMSDLAKKSGTQVDVKELREHLQIPVILTSAYDYEGIDTLTHELKSVLNNSHATQINLAVFQNGSSNIIGRYSKIETILKDCFLKKEQRDRILTKKIDQIVLHRVLGPLFLFIFLACLFQLVFSVAQVPVGWIESLIQSLQNTLLHYLPESLFRSLLLDGIIAGVGSVLVFLPQILLFYACLLFFEDTGYLARAAFLLDRLMSKIGLQGRSFIPLLTSFSCAIPGIMATRTIDQKKDRLLTILISPLMTCSARIPVYTLVIATFIPPTPVLGPFTLQGLTMLGLYFLGIFAAVLVAFILNKFYFKQQQSTFILELPTYKVPVFKNILLSLYDRGMIFLKRAGSIILALSILIWITVTFPKVDVPTEITEEKAIASYQLEHSIAGQVGKFIAPAVKPLGFDWKVSIALLSSFAAREIVVSSLSTVYAVASTDDDQSLLSEKLKHDQNFSLATAMSLLVFYAFACQCISTIAVAKRETNGWKYPIFMFTYMTILAYIASFAVFNLVNFLT